MNIQKIDFFSRDLGKNLVDSFRETGFAVITNPRVDLKLLFDTYKDWETFFKMSPSSKSEFQKGNNAGYIGPRLETAKNHKVPDLKEMYHWYQGQESKFTETGKIANTWELREQLFAVAKTLLVVIEDELQKRDVPIQMNTSLSQSIENTENNSLLRILHYPPLESFSGDELNGAQRAAPHEDINLISLLMSATESGLEVKDLKGNWHKVDSNSGDCIINAGDMIQETTLNYLRSTTHRVVANKEAATKSRYSMPFFLHPRPEVVLSSRYTSGSYLKERLDEILGNK